MQRNVRSLIPLTKHSFHYFVIQKPERVRERDGERERKKEREREAHCINMTVYTNALHTNAFYDVHVEKKNG